MFQLNNIRKSFSECPLPVHKLFLTSQSCSAVVCGSGIQHAPSHENMSVLACSPTGYLKHSTNEISIIWPPFITEF